MRLTPCGSSFSAVAWSGPLLTISRRWLLMTLATTKLVSTEVDVMVAFGSAGTWTRSPAATPAETNPALASVSWR